MAPSALSTALLGALPLLLVWIYRRLAVNAAERAVKFAWRPPSQARPGWEGRKLKAPSIQSHIGEPDLPRDGAAYGAAASDATRSWITAFAPASGALLDLVPSATREEIGEAIANAQRAQQTWATSTFAERRKVMRSLLDWCVRDSEDIARVASRDTGKTMVDAAFGEILTTCEKLRWLVANGEQVLKPESRSTNLALAHKVSKVHYEPLGVVCAIVSWNYPFHNLMSPMIAALMAGNAIVLKPSELVAWSSHVYVRAVRECLAACGADPELVQIVTTLPETVEALTGDERLAHITFIGSEQVGKKVAVKGAEAGTPVVLELGGKDPCVVLKSADLRFFGDTFMRAAFQAAGQNCIGAERFIVASELYEDFVVDMERRVKDLKVGDVLSAQADERVDVGAMVSDRLFGELESMIAAAVSQGARLLVGGRRLSFAEGDARSGGFYFAPTLLVDVEPSMALAQQELFAPVMTVMRARDVDHAVELANGTRYGLGASVFGRDKARVRDVMARLKAGMVCSNDFGVFYLNQSLPFGGCKASGYGRFAGPEGLRGLCNIRAVTEDRLHGLVQTSIPPALAYPIDSATKAWSFVSGLVELLYAREWISGRGKGLLKLAGA